MILTLSEWQRLSSRITEAEYGCWESAWSKRKLNKGYTQIWLRGKQYFVHKVVFEYLKNTVPIDKCLDHLCRNENCVNPAHLEVVTFEENIKRGKANYKKYIIFCKNKHRYTKENTYIRTDSFGNQHRYCRTCTNIRKA